MVSYNTENGSVECVCMSQNQFGLQIGGVLYKTVHDLDVVRKTKRSCVNRAVWQTCALPL